MIFFEICLSMKFMKCFFYLFFVVLILFENYRVVYLVYRDDGEEDEEVD